MEVLGRFQYHVIGGATGSGKGKLLDCLRDQGGQVPFIFFSASSAAHHHVTSA